MIKVYYWPDQRKTNFLGMKGIHYSVGVPIRQAFCRFYKGIVPFCIIFARKPPPRQKDFSAMYTIFRESMINWEIPNIKEAHA